VSLDVDFAVRIAVECYVKNFEGEVDQLMGEAMHSFPFLL
jgi:hypothetical protein